MCDWRNIFTNYTFLFQFQFQEKSAWALLVLCLCPWAAGPLWQGRHFIYSSPLSLSCFILYRSTGYSFTHCFASFLVNTFQVLCHSVSGGQISYYSGYILRGYKCLWLSLIKHLYRTFIPTNLISRACMLQKGCNSAKIKSAKTFRTVIPRKFIPSKYTRYIRYCGLLLPTLN